MKYGKYHCNSALKNEIWKIPLQIFGNFRLPSLGLQMYSGRLDEHD
jgi:hypothetical protein